jgi:hypothetical protein
VRLPLEYWSLWVDHENAAARRRPGGNLDLLERPRRHGVYLGDWRERSVFAIRMGRSRGGAADDPGVVRLPAPRALKLPGARQVARTAAPGSRTSCGAGSATIPKRRRIPDGAGVQEAYRQAGPRMPGAGGPAAGQARTRGEPLRGFTQTAVGIEEALARADGKAAGANGAKDVARLCPGISRTQAGGRGSPDVL